MNLNAELRYARARMNLTQPEVAERIGMPVSTYKINVERNKDLLNKIKLSTLLDMCDKLDEEFRERILNYLLTILKR